VLYGGYGNTSSELGHAGMPRHVASRFLGSKSQTSMTEAGVSGTLCITVGKIILHCLHSLSLQVAPDSDLALDGKARWCDTLYLNRTSWT